MAKINIVIKHYNRKKEEINISSKENREKKEAIIFDVINRAVSG